MPDPTKESIPQPIPPIGVTVIGGSEGAAGAALTTGTVAATPDHQPNIVVHVVTPVVAILVRFANAYLTTLVGLLSVGITTNALPASDFWHLVLKCSALSVAGPAFALLKDLLTIFGRLEQKFPLMTGSV